MREDPGARLEREYGEGASGQLVGHLRGDGRRWWAGVVMEEVVLVVGGKLGLHLSRAFEPNCESHDY